MQQKFVDSVQKRRYSSGTVSNEAGGNQGKRTMNEQAQPLDYIKEAAVTLSPSWHGNKVNLMLFRVALTAAVEALNELDAIKKTLFYGKELPGSLNIEGGETCEKLPVWFKNDKFGENVIHAIIGAATEAGELLEALRAVTIENKVFDEVNMREEVGDVFWYFAILADTCGFSFEEAQRVNIAKLRMRYGEKFSEFDANNRNLKAERSILEGGSKIVQPKPEFVEHPDYQTRN